MGQWAEGGCLPALGPGLSLPSFVLLHLVSVVCGHTDVLSWGRVKYVTL